MMEQQQPIQKPKKPLFGNLLMGKMENTDKPRKKPTEQPKRPEARNEIPLAPEERERRVELGKLVAEAQKLDTDFFTNIAQGGPIETRTQRLAAREAMTSGEEIAEPQPVGEPGINETTVRTFEGGVEGFTKKQNGEASFRVDLGTRTVSRMNHFLGEDGQLQEGVVENINYREITPEDTDLLKIEAAVRQSPEFATKGIHDPEELKKIEEDTKNEIFFREYAAVQQRPEFADASEEAIKEEIARIKDQPEANRIVEMFEGRAKAEARLVKGMADRYDVSTVDLLLQFPSGEYSPRYGIAANDSTIREWGVSRISEMFNLGVVQMTVLRSDHGDPARKKDTTDIMSVQETFKGELVSKELLDEISKLGPDHPGAKSFMRIAVLDYLVKSADRHKGNLMYNKETGEFSGIDNGLSLGLEHKFQEETEDGKTIEKQEPLDAYRSIPLEIAARHPNWKLDDEAMDEMKRIYRATQAYLAQRESGGEASGANGKEIKFISSVFRMIYKNEKIAQKEAIGFFQRLKEVIDNGRPPKLPFDTKGKAISPLMKIDAAKLLGSLKHEEDPGRLGSEEGTVPRGGRRAA